MNSRARQTASFHRPQWAVFQGSPVHRRTIKNAPFMFAVLKGGWTAALQLGRLLQSTLLFKHAEVSTTVESPLSWCQPRFLASRAPNAYFDGLDSGERGCDSTAAGARQSALCLRAGCAADDGESLGSDWLVTDVYAPVLSWIERFEWMSLIE